MRRLKTIQFQSVALPGFFCLNQFRFVFNYEQVAERQGKFLVELFNKMGKHNGGKALKAKDIPLGDPFVYKHLGSMASVGRYKALVDLRQSKVIHAVHKNCYVTILIHYHMF